jgi:hypothetical protein
LNLEERKLEEDSYQESDSKLEELEEDLIEDDEKGKLKLF